MAEEHSTPPRRDVHYLGAWLSLFYLEIGTLSIDADGRIWRHFVHNALGRRKKIQARRAECQSSKGYLSLVFGACRGVHGPCRIGAHRVVWLWVNGTIPDGMQINHKNLDKTDNRPENLEIVTPEANVQHSYANGRAKPWSKSPEESLRSGTGNGTWRGKPRVDQDTKNRIRQMRQDGVSYPKIAAAVGISVSHVHRIVKGGGR